MAMTRSKKRREMMELHINLDLISDILSRLPVKSVLRFKSVSKPWYAFIKTLHFIQEHQHKSNLNPILPFTAFLISVFGKTGKQVFRLHLKDYLDTPIDLDLPFLSEEKVRFLGISNGLVCLTFHEGSLDIIICNPGTGEFRKLPPCKGSIWHSCFHFFGFGFLENSYELIKIVFDSFVGIKAKLYSLDTNTWRDIHVKFGKHVLRSDHSVFRETSRWPVPILRNGVFYWGYKFVYEGCIMSFDVSNEVFDEMQTPPSRVLETQWKLIELKEELAVVIDHGSQWFDFWVLNEKEKTWTMKYSVQGGIFPRNVDSKVAVLGCTRSGELLMADHYNSKSYLYDMDSHNLEFLPSVFHGVSEPYLYTPSLVSVKTGHNAVEADSDLLVKKRKMKKKH